MNVMGSILQVQKEFGTI